MELYLFVSSFEAFEGSFRVPVDLVGNEVGSPSATKCIPWQYLRKPARIQHLVAGAA